MRCPRRVCADDVLSPIPATGTGAHGSNVSVSSLVGTYTAPAYGTFTLCAAPARSLACASVLAAFQIIGPLDADALYGAWPRLWSTHVRVIPATGAFELLNVFPAGYGADMSAFTVVANAGVRFEVDGDERNGVTGLGVSWDDWPAAKKKAESVRERAQVWFERVEL